MQDVEANNVTPDNMPEGSFQDEEIIPHHYRGINLFLLMIILAMMTPWLLGGYRIFGFNISGWAWVLPLIIAVLICLSRMRDIVFPLSLWGIWIILLLAYWFFGMDNPGALQSLTQTISPLFIGCAASTFRADNWQLQNVIRWLTRLALIAWIVLLFRMPLLLSGVLPGHGFMAAEMIGLLLLGACYASFYACGSQRHLYYYFSMLAITVVSLVRGPMVAMLSCIPLTFAPLGIRKRIALLSVVAICAIIVFNTERVQQRMFYSGSGALTDLAWDNPNLKKTGRDTFVDILWPSFQQNPLWGNGFNSYRNLFSEAGLELSLPHNDWLKLLHDIGIVGASLYLLVMLLQILALIKIARSSSGPHQMLAYGVATAFIPYILIMLTDNVVLYVQFFGNMHFALIGFVYGAVNGDEK